jgi:hypothetical protein
MDVFAFFCAVLSCVGRGLGAGLIPCPRSPTKCLNGSISKKKKSNTLKRHKEKQEEEEEEEEEEEGKYLTPQTMKGIQDIA